MKFFLLLGGFCGFALAFLASWRAGNPPGFALRDGSVGCLVGALLWRGFHAVLMQALRSHVEALVAAQTPATESAPTQLPS